MNQDFNNFNNQNNNMNYNQPAFGAPVNNFNQQAPNTFGQPQNNMGAQVPKKNNLPLIIGIAVAVVAVIVVCILAFGGDSKSAKKKEEEKAKANLKEITYFNSSSKNETDKLILSLEQSSETGKGLLFAIDKKGIAKNLRGDSYSLENDELYISKYSKHDGFSIAFNEENFIFELESEYYVKDENGETLDSQPIVYKENNYIVTENNIDSYTLYYLYDESYYNSYSDDEKRGSWSVVHISFPDTLDEAKERIKEIENNMDICIYNKEDGYDNCLTADGKKINYKKYKHIKDVLVDTLIDYDLYVDSYENITQLKSGEIYVEKYIQLEGVDNDYNTEFEIEFGSYDVEESKVVATSKLNGKEVKFTKPYSLHYANIKTKNGNIEILVNLPYGAEESNENAIKVLEETFKKTK